MELQSKRLIENLELNRISPTGGNGYEDGVMTFNENTGRVVNIYWLKERHDMYEKMKNLRCDNYSVMIQKDLCDYHPGGENIVQTIFDSETGEYVCFFIEKGYRVKEDDKLHYEYFNLQ